jgi:hypothetical protein
MALHIRYDASRDTFEVYDTNTGEVVPPDVPEARKFSGMTRSELTALSHTELAFGAGGALPSGRHGTTTSTIIHAPVAPVQRGVLTPDELKICDAMGIDPAEFLATRARQPHRWASESFYPLGMK